MPSSKLTKTKLRNLLKQLDFDPSDPAIKVAVETGNMNYFLTEARLRLADPETHTEVGIARTARMLLLAMHLCPSRQPTLVV